MEKTRKISQSSYNYLLEISAIPLHCREQYLCKLLKRKNSDSQKNVLLLKNIYQCIGENKISKWNTDDVCNRTGIKPSMIDCYKSRLLKGLKYCYLGWGKSNKIYKHKDIENAMKQAEHVHSMFKKGLFEEAKNKYFKIEKQIHWDHKSKGVKKENYITLSEIYENLILYYFFQRKSRELFKYFIKLKNVRAALKKFRCTIEEISILNIRYYYSRFYMFCLGWYKTKSLTQNNHSLEKVYEHAKAINSTDYILKILHHKSILQLTAGDLFASQKTAYEGCRLAKSTKAKTEFFTFFSILCFLKINSGETVPVSFYNKIIRHYYKAKKSSPLELWTLYLENSISMAYDPNKNEQIFWIFLQQIDSSILIGDSSFAIHWKFILDSETYLKKILSSLYINYTDDGKQFAAMHIPDTGILKDIDDLCINTLCFYKELSDLDYIWDVYLLQLRAILFSCDSADLSRAYLIIEKMNRIKRKHMERVKKLSSFVLIKLCVNILDDINYDPKSIILKKYETKLNRMALYFMRKPKELTLIDYSLFAFIADKLKLNEIWNIVINLYTWIHKNHPELIEPVLKQIQEKEKTIHLDKPTAA